jgi:serine/threonine-protein kinase
MLGRASDGIREKSDALALDPLSVVIRTDLGRMFYFAGDYDQAIREYLSALDLDPSFGSAHLWLANAYEQKGMFEQALSELRIGTSLYQGRSYALARLAYGFAIAGKRGEAAPLLEQLKVLSKRTYVSAYDIALVHLGLRDFDEALLWLRRALEERSLWLGYLNIEPQLDPLRADARFSELVRQVGLQPAN